VVSYRQFSVAISFCIVLEPLSDGAAKVLNVGNCYKYTYFVFFLTVVMRNYV